MTKKRKRVAHAKTVVGKITGFSLPILGGGLSWQHKHIAPLTGILAALFVLAGIAMVILGATGETEITIVGNSFKSQNVGIASIFCGVILALSTFRRLMKSIERLGQLKD